MAAASHPFWKLVNLGDPQACWHWSGSTDKDGYGYDGRERTHRVAWELFNRRNLLAGEVVRHRCDNPPCCNPTHLVAGTQTDNVQDMVDKGRTARGGFNGRAVLSNLQVLEIAAACGTYAELASRFGVSRWSIRDIKTGRNWGWLTGLNSNAPHRNSNGAAFSGDTSG